MRVSVCALIGFFFAMISIKEITGARAALQKRFAIPSV